MSLDAVSDKAYFFKCVSPSFQEHFSLVERFLGVTHDELMNRIFLRAKKLGYDRKKATDENKQNARIFNNANFWGVPFETIEDAYCHTAVFQLVQGGEREGDKQLLATFDYLTKAYDPVSPENYLESKPDDIFLQPFHEDEWLNNASLQIPDRIDSEFFTVYSWQETFNSALSRIGIEIGEVACGLLPEQSITRYQSLFDKLDIKDLVYPTKAKTLEDFRSISDINDKGAPWISVLIVRLNRWLFHSDNLLIRLTPQFMKSNRLQWDEASVLNLTIGNKPAARFQMWAAPYTGSSYDRHRKAWGARLQIRTDFLHQYLQKQDFALLVISEKRRELFRADHQGELIGNAVVKNHKVIANT